MKLIVNQKKTVMKTNDQQVGVYWETYPNSGRISMIKFLTGETLSRERERFANPIIRTDLLGQALKICSSEEEAEKWTKENLWES